MSCLRDSGKARHTSSCTHFSKHVFLITLRSWLHDIFVINYSVFRSLTLAKTAVNKSLWLLMSTSPGISSWAWSPWWLSSNTSICVARASSADDLIGTSTSSSCIASERQTDRQGEYWYAQEMYQCHMNTRKCIIENSTPCSYQRFNGFRMIFSYHYHLLQPLPN